MTILDWFDIWLMGSSASLVFLCNYEKRRDATVGYVLFVCWIYQIYETVTGIRISSLSDVIFDFVLFVYVLAAGGNIMSVAVFAGLRARWKWFKSLLGWKYENKR